MSAFEFLSEEELLLEISEGNEKAFEKLFFNYHQQLSAYIYGFTHSRETAKEIVQDVFLKAWLNRSELASVKSIKAYLFIISKNHVLNYLRKSVREHLLQKEWEKEMLNDHKNITDSSGHYTLLDKAVNQLSPQQKKVYLLSRHERLTYNEIADKLHISRETVKEYLQIANVSIKAYILKHHEVVLVSIFIYFFK